MSLLKYAIAVGIGYHFGGPDGRRQLEQLRQWAVRTADRPEVDRLRERGRRTTSEGAYAVRNLVTEKLGRRGSSDTARSADVTETGTETGTTTDTGFDGRTVAEDSHAAVMGTSARPTDEDLPSTARP